MGTTESNGHAPGAPVFVQFGPAEDDAVPVAVASKMLRALFEREDTLFTVLLAEAMTGVRLAKARYRASQAELADRAAAELEAAKGGSGG